MLNTFPTLLAFGLLAPFILRICLGFVFLEFGYSALTYLKEEKIKMFESINLKPGKYYVYIFAFIEVIIGVALTVGFLTQIASLLAFIICTLAILVKRRGETGVTSSYGFLTICLFISVSLMFSGAGFLAFDLPL